MITVQMEIRSVKLPPPKPPKVKVYKEGLFKWRIDIERTHQTWTTTGAFLSEKQARKWLRDNYFVLL